MLITLLANFGFNIWLKSRLPDLLKNNTDYRISYQSLNIEWDSGNIFASKISIATKESNNPELLKIHGTIDSLKVNRLGILEAVFKKKISSSHLRLVHPNLDFRLPKHKKHKHQNKESKVKFNNISIENGNFNVYRFSGQKIFSARNFQLKIDHLQLREDRQKGELPFVFDNYSISGKNIFLRPNLSHVIISQDLKTENGTLSIQNFRLVPLLSPTQFERFFPDQKKLLGFSAGKLNLTELKIEKHKISASDIFVQNSDLVVVTKMTKQDSIRENHQQLDLDFGKIKLDNAKVLVKKTNEQTVFSGSQINLQIDKLVRNQETEKQEIPLEYEDFFVSGKKIFYANQNTELKAEGFASSPKNLVLSEVSATPKNKNPNRLGLNFKGKKIQISLNKLAFTNQKLDLEFANIALDEINGNIQLPTSKSKQKADFSKINFPVIIKNISLKNSNIAIEKDRQPIVFKDFNAQIKGMKVLTNPEKKLVFSFDHYSATTKNFKYDTPFYQFSVGLLKLNKGGIELNQFAMLPKLGRSQFIRTIPSEKDLYTIKAAQISMLGKSDFFSQKKFVDASAITIQSMDANIFRSKIPKDDKTIKPMYSELLRRIKFPLTVREFNIKNSKLVYEEDTKKSDGPGKLIFTKFNLNAKNLNSNKIKGNSTKIPISINCKFFDVSPMNIQWNIDTANLSDAFTIKGNISDLPATSVNTFVEPYLKIQTRGEIQNIAFDFHGNKSELNGTFGMKHKNLNISVLKATGEKDKLLSAVANILVRTNSKDFAENAIVDDVKRDPSKSFFNLFWKGIEEGLKKTLISKNVEKSEKSIKKTIDDVKKTSKDVKSKVKEVTTPKNESPKNNPTDSDTKKKRKKLFGKKEKAEK